MNDKTDTSPEPDSRFNLIVTILLVVIIIALAGLWIVERGRRMRAETALIEEQVNSQKQIQSVGQVMLQQIGQMSSINRDQLATQQVDWNGQSRTVLLLSASEGEKLGFIPGDAILVTSPPAILPAATTK